MSEASMLAAAIAVDKRTEGEWKEEGKVIMAEFCRTKLYPTVDDAWRLLGPPPGKNSNMGGIMTGLCGDGVTKKSGWKFSSARSNHAGNTVWQSLVYEGGGDESLPPKTYKAVEGKNEWVAALLYEGFVNLFSGKISVKKYVQLLIELRKETKND